MKLMRSGSAEAQTLMAIVVTVGVGASALYIILSDHYGQDSTQMGLWCGWNRGRLLAEEVISCMGSAVVKSRNAARGDVYLPLPTMRSRTCCGSRRRPHQERHGVELPLRPRTSSCWLR